MGKQLRVLIADDSPTVRRFLSQLVSDAPDMTVVGEAHDGQEAITLAGRLQPDIISMDIQMPRLDGLAATRKLMQEHPLPIVIVSAHLDRNEAVDLAFMALQAGALAVLKTPAGYSHPEYAASRDQFLTTLRAMAGVSVVRRWTGNSAPEEPAPLPHPAHTDAPPMVIAIGASAGGPVALHAILTALPVDFPIPIAVVQHMAEGFIEGLIRWLDKNSPLHIMQAAHGQIVRPGEVVLAGSGSHLALQRLGQHTRVVLHKDQEPTPYLPAVDVLFRSAAEQFGAQALGVLLTGMGDDGARGLLTLREHGARTLVQDQDSCLVYGMPGSAVQIGAAEQIVPLHQIAPTILDLVESIPKDQEFRPE